MEQKSIIGCGYMPRDVKAVCLKTDHETLLDGVEYKIIAAPYERSFIKLHNPGGTRVRYDAMAVNVLDPRTGLTYAVEYHPANLVRENAESPQAAATESPKMDSAAYIEKIISYAEALNKMAKDNPEVGNDCGVLLIFGRINENEKKLCGRRGRRRQFPRPSDRPGRNMSQKTGSNPPSGKSGRECRIEKGL